MRTYSTILAAVDFSEYSGPVTAHAVTLARELKAELIFVNVINQRDIDIVERALGRASIYNENLSVKEYVNELHTERKEKMNELIDRLKLKGVAYRTQILAGVPFEALMQAVDKEKANLMVMGVKGRSNLADVIVGSTAAKVFRRSPVPLVSVREAKP